MKTLKTYNQLTEGREQKSSTREVNYQYLPQNLKDDLISNYSDEILDTMLTHIFNVSSSAYAMFEDESYSWFVNVFFDNDIFTRMRKSIQGNNFSTPELMNTINDIITETYEENREEIDKSIDDRVVQYYKDNKDEYIDEDISDFPKRITDRLAFIVKAKEFNI